MEDFGAEQKVKEQERIQRALKAFQDAARNRTKDPDAFEAAKTRYYFLTKGPEWLEQEKQRILSEKLDPVVADYRDQFNSLDTEEKVQSAYTDSIAAIRDKQDTLRGSAERQSSFFQRLIENESAQKSAFDRVVELTNPSSIPAVSVTEDAPLFVRYFAGYPTSFRIILDIVLGLLIFFILFLGLRKTRLAVFSMGSFFSAAPAATSGPGIFISTPAFGPARTAVLNPR
jgi:hypothetical protein